MILVYRLYRYTHADGTAKEWAYADNGAGSAVIRWGRSGSLRNSQIKGFGVAQARADEKERKGYEYVGERTLDECGVLVGRHRTATRPPPVATPQKPTSPPINITAILGGDDDAGAYF